MGLSMLDNLGENESERVLKQRDPGDEAGWDGPDVVSDISPSEVGICVAQVSQAAKSTVSRGDGHKPRSFLRDIFEKVCASKARGKALHIDGALVFDGLSHRVEVDIAFGGTVNGTPGSSMRVANPT